jgi:hypothetical protein
MGLENILLNGFKKKEKVKDNALTFLEIKDCWVNEYALLDFACKDLAKFFLSRIKWGTK